MKNILLPLTLFLLTSSIHAQEEKAITKTISARFAHYYNQSSYDSIFMMFSEDMQEHLTLVKTIQFCSGLKIEIGNIVKMNFSNYSAEGALYPTEFQGGFFDVRIAIDENRKVSGLLVTPHEEVPRMERSKSSMILPFHGSWNVVWGGDTKELNYHVESRSQKNAFDILILDTSGKSYRTDGKSNEDYYAFGKELIAPCAGKVILVVDGIKDNIPGVMNSFHTGGNTVIIQTPNNEFLVFCHFKQHSIRVKEGQKVKQGQLLGLCGNSGHSSEAHLHFHIQDMEDMNKASGVKCYFENIYVNGRLKTDCSPVKDEVISNKK